MEKLFVYNESNVRTEIDTEGNFWFVGVDVCNILEYEDSYQAIMKLDDDERKLDRARDGSGQNRKAWTVNEFGLYSLILTSTKPEAKAFKRWITHDVLPALRKAGKYTSEEEREREESIQNYVSDIENLIAERDGLKEKTARKTKEIEKKNTELMQLLKTDFRQMKIKFPEP